MFQYRNLVDILLLFTGLCVFSCQGQTTISATPRYSTLLQNLAAASRARSILESQLKTYRQTFQTLRKNELSAAATCSCSNDSSVAFTAFLNKNIATFGIQQPVPFDNVTFNDGNAYDTRSEAFTAPVDGIYEVSVTIATNAGYTLVVDILHNRSLLAKLRTGNDNQWHTATNSVIVRMKKGDDIWVEHDRTTSDSNKLYYGSGMITSFSGFLIHRD